MRRNCFQWGVKHSPEPWNSKSNSTTSRLSTGSAGCPCHLACPTLLLRPRLSTLPAVLVMSQTAQPATVQRYGYPLCAAKGERVRLPYHHIQFLLMLPLYPAPAEFQSFQSETILRRPSSSNTLPCRGLCPPACTIDPYGADCCPLL
jgi:hypothetical protein